MIRWIKFNAVGLAGVVVQLSALALLTSVFRVPYLFATPLAVEMALLHNFVWHEFWTWRGLAIESRWLRLLRFHLASGFLSIGANTLFTWWFKHHFGLPLLAANLAAIAATSLLNFAVNALWVFRTQAR